MDPHSFFANPDPPVFKNKDTVNANRIQLKKLRTKLSYKDFTVVEKTKNKMLKSKNNVSAFRKNRFVKRPLHINDICSSYSKQCMI